MEGEGGHPLCWKSMLYWNCAVLGIVWGSTRERTPSGVHTETGDEEGQGGYVCTIPNPDTQQGGLVAWTSHRKRSALFSSPVLCPMADQDARVSQLGLGSELGG